jgi:hypothetical protein
MATITDEVALEQARLKSLPSNRPPPMRQTWSDIEVEVDLSDADIATLVNDEQIVILRARLAPLSRVVVLARPMSELGPLLEDPRTAYVLSFIDGILPLESIIDATGLPEVETLRVLDRMLGQAVIVVDPAR